MIPSKSDPKPPTATREAFLLSMSEEAADRLPLAAWRERQRLIAAKAPWRESLTVRKDS